MVWRYSMKTHKIRIAKRDFALLFNYAAMAELVESIEGFDIGDVVNLVKSPKTFPVIIACLARAGEAEEGRELDVDADWFAHHMRPSPVSIMKITTAVNEALTDGIMMETEDEDDGEADVVLEDLKKKEAPDGSPSGS